MTIRYTQRAVRSYLYGYAAALLSAALIACGGGGGGATTDAASTSNASAIASQASASTDMVELGRLLFSDPNLSEPRGTACVACHAANRGHAGNHGSGLGVAQGSLPTSIGLRNSLTNGYSGLVPAFGFVVQNGALHARGGLFWDGRADTLAQQALGPFLNPLEMNNPSATAVVNKIAAAPYAPLFQKVFGASVWGDANAAFTQVGVAIEAFERATLQPFSSKFDAMVRGTTTLSAAEARGMALFTDPNRANCSGCHTMNPGSGQPQDSSFSDFKYYALGVPRNSAIPNNADPAFFDLGLCGPQRTAPTLPASVPNGETIDNFCGKFRVPTLRNVALRGAFMHNGFFSDLREVVRFYASRNSNPVHWYGASGIANDLPNTYLGNIEQTKAPFNRSPALGTLLTESEVTDLVTFMQTLNDGFVP